MLSVRPSLALRGGTPREGQNLDAVRVLSWGVCRRSPVRRSIGEGCCRAQPREGFASIVNPPLGVGDFESHQTRNFQ